MLEFYIRHLYFLIAYKDFVEYSCRLHTITVCKRIYTYHDTSVISIVIIVQILFVNASHNYVGCY